MTAANLMSLIGKSKSCQSLTSSGNPPCHFQPVAPQPIVDILHLFVISARLSQRAAALATWAPRPAAARRTQASLTSSPELLHTSHSSKSLLRLSLLGRQHHSLLVLSKHKWSRFVWWCSSTWKLQTHHDNTNVVVLHLSAYFSSEDRCMNGPAGLISVDTSTETRSCVICRVGLFLCTFALTQLDALLPLCPLCCWWWFYYLCVFCFPPAFVSVIRNRRGHQWTCELWPPHGWTLDFHIHYSF